MGNDRATTENTESPQGPLRRNLVLLIMTVGYFLVLLDVTIINVTLPSIRVALGAEVSELQWIVDGYAVALASILLTGGTFGDLYGHKRVVLTGLSVFGLASFACGLAPTSDALIGARIAQGMGAAVLLPGTLAIITGTYGKERAAQGWAISIWAAVGSLALPAGPLLGGLLVETVGWRSVFIVNLPIVGLAIVASVLAVQENNRASSQKLDSLGLGLATVLLATLTFAFIEGGSVGWISAPVLAASACAVIAFVAFILVESRSQSPMLPLEFFRTWEFTGANAVAGLMNLVALGTIFLLTLYLQVVQGHSALVAGAETVPMFVPLSMLSPISGRLAARFGPRLPMTAGLALGILGMVLLRRLEADSGYLLQLFPPMVCIGACLGLLTPAVVAAAMGSLPASRSGLASGANNTARQAAGAIGVALFGALAGTPNAVGSFLEGLHTAALLGAGLWVGGIVLTLTLSGRPKPVCMRYERTPIKR
ncbi:MAG: MFS transporter [Rubrobacter sp.]|nr:MFS transporter [Rubrobacter sp.]